MLAFVFLQKLMNLLAMNTIVLCRRLVTVVLVVVTRLTVPWLLLLLSPLLARVAVLRLGQGIAVRSGGVCQLIKIR